MENQNTEQAVQVNGQGNFIDLALNLLTNKYLGRFKAHKLIRGLSGNTMSVGHFLKEGDNVEIDGTCVISGGISYGTGFGIEWQDGVIENNEQNGAMIEDIMMVLIDRLDSLNRSKYFCRENSISITKMQEALMWQKQRTEDRKQRKVEGKYEH